MSNATTIGTPATDKHPRGLYVLFGTEMWERFSFYTMNAMVVLYVTNSVQGFGWSNAQATNVFSYYLMFVYASPLIGGFIADRWTGPRHAITIGGLFFMAGHLLLAVPKNIPIFYVALTCLVIGNGFFKPNVSSMVGNLYPEGSHLKDKAYLIFYMGINIGALLAPIVAEYVQGSWGYHYAFAVAAFGMVISLTVFWSFQKYVRVADRQRGDFQKADGSRANQEAVATSEDLPPVLNENARMMQAVPEWKRIMALIVIFLIVIVFWMVFHQNSSTLTLWADDHTAWNVTGILSNAINPLWIIVLSLPLAAFWTWLDKKGLEPSTPAKMMIGMTLTGLSFIVLYFAAQAGGFTRPALQVVRAEGNQAWVTTSPEAARHLGLSAPQEPVQYQVSNPETGQPETLTAQAWRVENPGGLEQGGFAGLESNEGGTIRVAPTRQVSPWWLIMAYAVLSLGELMLSPMGLSLVSQVAPVRWRGLMMGGWFGATAIGNKLTAIGNYWDLWSHAQFFIILACMALVMAVVLLLLLKPLRKAMPGV
jgi:proton-dependent oligopeptide transporter, POT family